MFLSIYCQCANDIYEVKSFELLNNATLRWVYENGEIDETTNWFCPDCGGQCEYLVTDDTDIAFH